MSGVRNFLKRAFKENDQFGCTVTVVVGILVVALTLFAIALAFALVNRNAPFEG